MATSGDIDLINNCPISALLGPADGSGAVRLSAVWGTQMKQPPRSLCSLPPGGGASAPWGGPAALT